MSWILTSVPFLRHLHSRFAHCDTHWLEGLLRTEQISMLLGGSLICSLMWRASSNIALRITFNDLKACVVVVTEACLPYLKLCPEQPKAVHTGVRMPLVRWSVFTSGFDELTWQHYLCLLHVCAVQFQGKQCVLAMLSELSKPVQQIKQFRSFFFIPGHGECRAAAQGQHLAGLAKQRELCPILGGKEVDNAQTEIIWQTI